MTEFLGNCRVTGIGSLPHIDPGEACDFVLRTSPQLPYWPQLPAKDEREGMIDQFARGLPGIKKGTHTADIASPGFHQELERFYTKILSEEIEEFALADFEASALFELAKRTEAGELPAGITVKGQITGPVTMGLQLYDADKRFLIYDDTFRDAIVRQLVMKARWLEKRLEAISPRGERVIFLDEPLLYTYGSAHYNFPREHVVGPLREVLAGIKGVGGIHACSNCDWSLIFDAAPGIFSFDAYSYAETFLIYEDRIADFVRSGGNIAWGIVPNTDGLYDKETGDSLVARMDRILDRLQQFGLSEEEVLRRSLITPGCGVGSLSIEAAEKVFSLANEVSRVLQARLGRL